MFWRGKIVIIVSFFINRNCEWEKSMKKLILALSVVGILCLGAVSSQALVGMPDAVPGTHLIQPFFLVPIPGTDGTDNTLMALTEVKGIGGPPNWESVPPGKIHWVVWNRESEEVANGYVPYTKYDVVVLNARDLILKKCSANGLKSLEVDLDGDGDNEYYMGYITYENVNHRWQDNFIGHMYVVDLPTGRASGAIIPAREFAPNAGWNPESDEWWPMQNSRMVSKWMTPYTRAICERTDYEVFTGAALACSKLREHTGSGFNPMLPDYFRLLPRYFLKDHTGETFFFIWTSGNWGKIYDEGNFDPDAYQVTVNMFDEDEHIISGPIELPYELNFINVRNTIPTDWLETALGGWFDIKWEISEGCRQDLRHDHFPWIYNAIPLAAEWLGYSYQFAHSPDGTLNWNALFPIHRDTEDMILVDIPEKP
jgi:hypothetical protein